MAILLTRRQMLLSLAASQEDPTFSAGVKVVNILATVRTRSGEIVSNLTRDDFTILEDSRPQKLSYFATETDLPLTLGLLIDTSTSQERVLNAQRRATSSFLDRVLRPDKDKIFLLQFDMGVYLKQPLTASRKSLDEAMAFVDTPSRKELEMQVGGGTLLYDAVAKAAEIMQPQTNRKALILLSDGVDTGSHAALAECIEAAQRSDTLIYGIYFTGESPFFINGAAILAKLSKESGGHFFSVSKKLNIDRTFDQIQAELRSQYSIGFVSDTPVAYPAYRKLKLATRDPKLIVQCREGYWPKR